MRLIFWTGLAVLLIDQISKYVILHILDLSRIRSYDVLPPLLNFRYGENRGINFGLFGDSHDAMRWVLIGFALLVSVAIVIWLRKSEKSWTMYVSAGLLIGGAIGNVVDRLIYGYVVDFLNMSCCGIHNPFVFNLADVFIFAGAIGLVLFDQGKSDDSAAKNAP